MRTSDEQSLVLLCFVLSERLFFSPPSLLISLCFFFLLCIWDGMAVYVDVSIGRWIAGLVVLLGTVVLPLAWLLLAKTDTAQNLRRRLRGSRAASVLPYSWTSSSFGGASPSATRRGFRDGTAHPPAPPQIPLVSSHESSD